jgi:hypothetical protein
VKGRGSRWAGSASASEEEKEKEQEAMGARRRGLDDEGDHDDARNRLATWLLEVKS